MNIHDRKAIQAALVAASYKVVGPATGYPSPGAWAEAVNNMQARAIHAERRKYMRHVGMDNKYPKPHQGAREMERRRIGGFASLHRQAFA